MDQVIMEVLKQVPALAVLAWLTGEFLRHLQGMVSRHEATEEKRDRLMREQGVVCHGFQREMMARQEAAMERLAVVLERNAVELARSGDRRSQAEMPPGPPVRGARRRGNGSVAAEDGKG